MDKFRWAERHDGLISRKISRASGDSNKQWRQDHESNQIRRL